MGKEQREKGKRFERKIATILREYYPDMVVRRTQQSDKAYESDVVVDGLPIWWECHDSKNPAIYKKLDQMEGDAPENRVPVLVWKRTGDARIWVTLRLDNFLNFITLVRSMLGRLFVSPADQ